MQFCKLHCICFRNLTVNSVISENNSNASFWYWYSLSWKFTLLMNTALVSSDFLLFLNGLQKSHLQQKPISNLSVVLYKSHNFALTVIAWMIGTSSYWQRLKKVNLGSYLLEAVTLSFLPQQHIKWHLIKLVLWHFWKHYLVILL